MALARNTRWDDDAPRMAAAIATLARFLIDARDSAERSAVAINDRALRAGHAFDRRADTAEGAQGAYSIAIHALRGAMQVDDIAVLTGETVAAFAPMAPPERGAPDKPMALPCINHQTYTDDCLDCVTTTMAAVDAIESGADDQDADGA